MESVSPNNAPEVRAIRKWFLVALVISLALHGLLYEVFRVKKLERFTFSGSTERLIPRAFTVKKVVINEDLLKPASTPELKKTEPPKAVFQNEKPSLDKLPTDVRFTPSAPPAGDLTKAIVSEKPRVEAGKLTAPESVPQVEKEIDSMRDQLATKNAPKILAGTGGALPDAKNGEHDGDQTPGYSNIDTLLEQSGPLSGNVAPLNMPGGALFDYDKASLRPDAIETLQKLGMLIGRNPRSTFSIEGHTDSFGTPDYNNKLSRARAEAVKNWLVTNMKLDPTKIQTKGFGSSRLIAPASGNREEQAPNRRVEIVIRTPKAPGTKGE